ncbi:hypothetical protein C7H84_08695 [Burkholderia sp. Nafp2/4-1b]|nr:hypothetical protein C7H84_08695 [Burkholderia sp. Nafp2/4-1b]
MTRNAPRVDRAQPDHANRVKSAGHGNTLKYAFSLRPFWPATPRARGRCHCDARYRLSRFA